MSAEVPTWVEFLDLEARVTALENQQVPEPEPEPGPGPGPGPVLNALDNPSAFGWPDATNTGVPQGVSLIPVSGKIEVLDGGVQQNDVWVITRPQSGSVVWGPITCYPDRTVVEKADLVGRVQMKSSLDLYLNQSRLVTVDVPSASKLIETQDALGGHTFLTDCDLDANQHAAAIYGWGGPLSALRCNIRGGEDVMWLQGSGPTRVIDSYLHDPVRKEGSHNDLLQTGGVIDAVVSHCTLIAVVEGPDDIDDPMNAVLMASNFGGPVGSETLQGIILENSLCDGGNYMFADNWQTVHPVYGVTIRNNRIGRRFRYGPKSITNAPTDPEPSTPTWTWEGNVWDDTNEPV